MLSNFHDWKASINSIEADIITSVYHQAESASLFSDLAVSLMEFSYNQYEV